MSGERAHYNFKYDFCNLFCNSKLGYFGKKGIEMFDENEPIKSKEFAPRNLESLSLDELEHYIVEMQAEIEKTQPLR